MYHARFNKYAKFYKDPLQSTENMDTKLANFYEKKVCQGASRY